MRQHLTAKKSFTYAGRALKAGDPFSAPREEARVLHALGRAVPAGVYQTTEAQPTVTKAPVKKPAVKKPRAQKAAPK